MMHPPANIEPFVRVLGEEKTVEFLLRYGGAELYFTTNPKGRSDLAKTFGIEAATELAEAAEYLPRRIPLAKEWIAQRLRKDGMAVAQIARTMHTTDVTVRKYLKNAPPKGDDSRQKTLF